MKFRKSTITTTLFFVSFAILTGALRKFLFPESNHGAAGSMVSIGGAALVFARVSLFLSFFLFLIASFVMGVKKSKLIRALLFWAPLIFYMWLTLLWSSDFGSAFPRVILMTSSLLIICAIASNPDIVRAFYLAFGSFALFSSFLGVFLFAIGSDYVFFSNGYGRSFNGLFSHKGMSSEISGVGLIILLSLASNRRLIAGIVPALTTTATLLLSATFSAFGGVAAAILGTRAFRISLISVGVIAAFLPAIFYLFTPLIVLLGKDPTFTGRTILWAFTLENATRSPLLGHGFNRIGDTSAWMQMLSTEFKNDSFEIPNSHNLWVESTYTFGAIGTALLFFTMIIRPAIAEIKRNDLSTNISLGIVLFYAVRSGLTVPFISVSLSSIMLSTALTQLIVSSKQRSFVRSSTPRRIVSLRAPFADLAAIPKT